MKLRNKPRIGFIGQGYIGKNYADDFERRKYEVVRYALEDAYRNNRDRIRDCDIVFLAVPTPTTPRGFDASILRKSLPLLGVGKIAVIKSTILPGTTERLQKKFSHLIVLNSPEFLSEATAARDAANPAENIIGLPKNTKRYQSAARKVLSVLPKAPFSLVCGSAEAEVFKYAHNTSGYVQVVLFNLLYDLAKKLGCDWEPIATAIRADPYISNRYARPVHKSGRGAGGHCFIKDFEAILQLYRGVVGDSLGVKALKGFRNKNLDLLIRSRKDLDLLKGVYGKKKTTRTHPEGR